MPKISIILPVYNAERYLAECLDSVLSQTFADWELVAVDDGSKDVSGEILDKYAAKDSRIRVLHKANAGVWAARNDALEMVCGEWVTFLDADDAYAPYWLETAMHVADEERDVCCIRQKYYWGIEHPAGFDKKPDNVNAAILYGREAAERCWQTFPLRGFLWLTLIKLDLIRNSRFRPEINCKEDGVWLMELIPQITCFCETDYCGYFYRRTSGSLTKKNRSVLQCCSYLNALRDIWQTQRSWREGNKLNEIVMNQLRFCADNDVIEWIAHRKIDDECDVQNVRLAYSKLQASGVLNAHWQGRKRYWLAFSLWEHLGWIWPISFIYFIFSLGGRIMRKSLKIG